MTTTKTKVEDVKIGDRVWGKGQTWTVWSKGDGDLSVVNDFGNHDVFSHAATRGHVLVVTS